MKMKHGHFFTWYLLVVILLVALLFELLSRPLFLSPFFWLRLFLVLAALIGSFFVFGEHQKKQNSHKTEYGRLRNGLLAELRKKNVEIQRLKDERQIFLNTAVKQAARTVEVSQSLHSEKKENNLAKKRQ